MGPMPTPAVSHLTRSLRADGGIVISASHNPHYDNGIKFFSAKGEKLDDATELAIEAALEHPFRTVASEHMGKAVRTRDAIGRYVEACKNSVSRQFDLQRHAHRGGLRARRDLPDRPDRAARTRRAGRSDRRGAQRTQHQRRCRLDSSGSCWRRACAKPARTWASPSTATATACCSSMATAKSSMATACSMCWPTTGRRAAVCAVRWSAR